MYELIFTGKCWIEPIQADGFPYQADLTRHLKLNNFIRKDVKHPKCSTSSQTWELQPIG